jgi:RNA polymerase sigma-70 factor (ECF subfamily)
MDLAEKSDQELLALTAAGNQGAFEILVRRYRSSLANFLHRMIPEAEQIEDILQDTFIRVYRHRSHAARIRDFGAWIYSIAANRARDELRRRKRRPTTELSETLRSHTADRKWGPEQKLRDRELKDALDQAIAQLNVKYRMVFLLRDVEGMSYEEIARTLGIRVGTVKSRLNRARLSLQRELAPLLEGK